MTQRNILMDFLKGFAIILVVLGHSIQTTQAGSFDDNPVFKLIYSFHMPLFMFISGFVSYKTFDGTLRKLHSRLKSLVIPFLAWFALTLTINCLIEVFTGGPQPDILESIGNLLKSPDYGLWFLWILFLNYITLYFALKISKTREEVYIFGFFIVLNLLLYVIPQINYLGLGLLSWHMFFYLIGYATHKHLMNRDKLLKIIGIISLIAYPILVIFWTRLGPPAFTQYSTFSPSIITLISLCYKFLVPITAIFAIYTIFQTLIQSKYFYKTPILYLGTITLEIYATHFLFIYYLNPSKTLPMVDPIIMTFIAALGGSILLQHILKKSRILSTVLYGKPKPNNT